MSQINSNANSNKFYLCRRLRVAESPALSHRRFVPKHFAEAGIFPGVSTSN